MKKIAAPVLAAAVLVALVIWGLTARRAEVEPEQAKEAPIGSASKVTRSASGEAVLKLDADTLRRAGIEVRAVGAASLPLEVAAYGKLEEDPSRTFVVRAPVAGRLVAANWPGIGQVLADGAVVGSVEPRIAPVERLGLAERLSSARAEMASAAAALDAARASYKRLKALNADGRNVSDRAVEEAEARMKTEEARASGAGETVKALAASLNAGGAAAALPLPAGRGGQVVEIPVQPGESVEAGQALLRVARFDRLVARVDVPAGDPLTGPVRGARIVPVGREDTALHGERIGMAATVDPKVQGQAFLFCVAGDTLNLRPGLAVTAYLPQPGPPRNGVLVPAPALVRYGGKTWAYVETAPGQFARREVDIENSTAAGWFTRSLQAGDRVVTAGAQLLLSEELKSQIQVGEEKPA